MWKHPRMLTGWMTSLITELVRDAQERVAVIGLFLQVEKKGDIPEWNDISAQGTEFTSYWAQWKSLVADEDGLYCRQFAESGKS